MRLLTAPEIRAAIAARFPPEEHELANQICFSSCDIGHTLGLANAPRQMNPFGPPPPEKKAKR